MIRTVLDRLLHALDYRSYRLTKNSHYNDGRIAQKISKYQNRFETQLKKMELDKSESISILAFLKEFRVACDSIAVHKRATM